jgi:predicted DNA-binding transcriptional regulator AlpA
MEPNFDTLPDSAYVRVKAVVHLLPYSRATVWRKVAEDEDFPKPVKLGPGCTAWNVGDLRRHLANMKAAGAPKRLTPKGKGRSV